MTATKKRKSNRRLVQFLVGCLVGGMGVYFVQAYRHQTGPFARNVVREHGSDDWAEPIKVQGVENCHKVSDVLYRGAQPDKEGMKNLRALGVRTIVNLRALHSDRDEIGDEDLKYEHIQFQPWHPKDEEIVRFLQIVAEAENQPVFVHCKHGSDRTGTMCAIYRIAVQGWSKADALREMTNGGFGFHAIWENLEDYIRELDVEAIKEQAGLE